VKVARRDNPELLTWALKDLTNDTAGVSERDYPSFWSTSTPGSPTGSGQRLALNYEFEPGKPDDGVSVDVPLALLTRSTRDAFSWQVPGHREELVTALIRSLRKDLRRNFVPVPDTVRAALARVDPARGSLVRRAVPRAARAGRGHRAPGRLALGQRTRAPAYLVPGDRRRRRRGGQRQGPRRAARPAAHPGQGGAVLGDRLGHRAHRADLVDAR